MPMVATTRGTRKVQQTPSAELADVRHHDGQTHFFQTRGLLDAGNLEGGLPATLAAGDPLIQGDRANRQQRFTRGRGGDNPLSCQLGNIENYVTA